MAQINSTGQYSQEDYVYDYEEFYRSHLSNDVKNNKEMDFKPLVISEDYTEKEYQMLVTALTLANLLLIIVFYLALRFVCCNVDDDRVYKISRNNNLELDRYQLEEYQAQSDAWAKSIEEAQEARFKRSRRKQNRVKSEHQLDILGGLAIPPED